MQRSAAGLREKMQEEWGNRDDRLIDWLLTSIIHLSSSDILFGDDSIGRNERI